MSRWGALPMARRGRETVRWALVAPCSPHRAGAWGGGTDGSQGHVSGILVSWTVPAAQDPTGTVACVSFDPQRGSFRLTIPDLVSTETTNEAASSRVPHLLSSDTCPYFP